MQNKTLKQYFSLRGLLARRLREKKREIEIIRVKNRLYACPYGVYDLSKIVGMKNYVSLDNRRVIDFLGSYGGYIHRLEFENTDQASQIAIAIVYAVSEQLKQLKAYE